MHDIQRIIREPMLLEPLRASVDEAQPPVYLRSTKIKITARCNLHCTMCTYGKGMDAPELPTDDWLRITDQLADMGVKKVHFSGGEVLVRRDVLDIIANARARGTKVTLTSNLTLLDHDTAKALVRLRVRTVSTSLDGPTSKTHDSVRGVPGAFKRTLRGLDRLASERERRGRGPRLLVNFTMMQSNFRQYPDVIRIAAEHGVENVVPMPVDAGVDDTQFRLTKHMIRQYNEEIAPKVREVREQVGMPLSESFLYPFGRSHYAIKLSSKGKYAGGYYRENLCYAPYLHMFVTWEGHVYPCCMTRGRTELLGDLSKQSVREVFQGDAFQRLRAEMKHKRLKACHRCDMFLDENRILAGALRGEQPTDQDAPGDRGEACRV